MLRSALTVAQARVIQRIDMGAGLSAATLLIVGPLRITYEKGSVFYLNNTYFLLKMAFFVAAILISLYPTFFFFSWSRGLKRHVAPDIPTQKLHRARLCLILELLCVLAMILCAPLMARGIGYFGR